MKFEYRITEIEARRVDRQAQLDELGRDGWEHYFTDPRGDAYFKREVVAPPPSPAPVIPEVTALISPSQPEPPVQQKQPVLAKPLAPPLKPKGK
jgi:hypothetical protein